jgi:hypothetical protein
MAEKHGGEVLLTSGQSGRTKDDRERKRPVTRYILQSHTHSDSLPAIRPCLLQFPPSPNHPFNYESINRLIH